jgi:hypothetical protein
MAKQPKPKPGQQARPGAAGAGIKPVPSKGGGKQPRVPVKK